MMEKLLYFHFHIANKEVQLTVAGQDGQPVEQAVSPLNFEDNLFSALNVLHRLMTAGGGRSGFRPDREFIRKIGRILASLLNLSADTPAAVQQLFEKHWQTLTGAPKTAACFTFDFAQQPPYTELAELPWEFLSYQNSDLATGNSPACDFIRKIQTPAPAATPVPVKKGEPLNILLVISEPDPDVLRQSDKGLVAYRESYVYRLLRLYENLVNGPETGIRLRILFQPRPAEIQQAQVTRKALDFDEFLQRFQKNMVEPDSETIRSPDHSDFRPHIVHFLGHVCTDERDEEMVGCINEDNNLVFLPFQAFTACFAAAPPNLFLLQTPEGARLHQGRFTQSGLLIDLAAKRLPYLLSFQHPINEQGSLAFLRELYNRLLDTQSVPAAVSGARGKLSRDLVAFTDANAFGSPTLYTALPPAGPLHFSLVTAAGPGGEKADAEKEKNLAAETLQQKIERYAAEIRRGIEKADYEAALLKFKEIAEIAVRSPESDTPLARTFNDDATSLLGRYNDIETAYKQRRIDEPARSNNRIRLGYDLLQLMGKFPAVTQKPADTPVVNTPVTEPSPSKKTIEKDAFASN